MGVPALRRLVLVTFSRFESLGNPIRRERELLCGKQDD